MVLANIILSFPGGFILGMVAPLNFAKLDNLAACDSAGKLDNLDWFLLIGQITVQHESLPAALYLSVVCQPFLHGTSSTGKRGTRRELLTILQATPTYRPLPPYAPKLCMGLQNVALSS